MKKIFKPIIDLLNYDLKRLILIEVFIKIMGIFIIFPIFRIGFFFSLRLSGFNYISNSDLYTYLFKPTTIILAFIFLVIFALYILLEYVLLTLLFHEAKMDDSLTYKEFISLAFKRYYMTLKKYHIFIVLPTLLFFVLFEFVHISLFSSSINIPESLMNEITAINYPDILVPSIFILLILFFIEFIFFTHHLIINQSTLKNAYLKSRNLLVRQRLRMMARYLFYNLLLNLIFIGLFTLIVSAVGLVTNLFRSESIIYGIIITSLYSIYWILSIIFSSILIPVNIAIGSYKYYQYQEVLPIKPKKRKNKLDYKANLRTIILLFTLGFFILFSLNFFTISTDIRNTDDRFQILKQEEIIAHRGSSLQAPENTLSAIEIAIEEGAHAVEFDVRNSSDHVPILLHDESLNRTTNYSGSRLASELPYHYIKDLDAGSWFSEDYHWEYIPSLEEAFKLIDNRVDIFIDVKTSDKRTEEEIIRLIEAYELTDQVKIMSFKLSQLKRFKDANPDIQTVMLISSYYGSIDFLIEDENIDHFALRTSILDRHPTIVKSIHASGKNAYAWVVDDERTINIGIQTDVDGFITKNPSITRELAYSKNTNDILRNLLENLFK
jgi:glycerophosphoryl diester phosphodiesterase